MHRSMTLTVRVTGTTVGKYPFHKRSTCIPQSLLLTTMSCTQCFKLHPATHHLNDCYPPPKQLLAGTEYRPLSDQLAKFLYYARNHPSQLARLGNELERRIIKDARGSTGGYPKSRANLLVSLSILKALVAECRRDLGLFTRSAIRAITHALDVKVYQKDHPDIEIIARASSCFASLATFTESAPFADSIVNSEYIAVLHKLATLAKTEQVALVGLGGAAGSDALTWSDKEAFRQLDIICPAIVNSLQRDVDSLRAAGRDLEGNTSFFHTIDRPTTRRAPSVRNREDDVALRAFKALLEQCRVNQMPYAVDTVLGCLQWNQGEWCCLVAELLVKYAPLEYRHVVANRLVAALDKGDTKPTAKQSTLIAMLTTVLSESLVGISISNMLDTLIDLVDRRIKVHERDALLPPLVQCIAALANHIYYPDQIGDMLDEICTADDEARAETIASGSSRGWVADDDSPGPCCSNRACSSGAGRISLEGGKG